MFSYTNSSNTVVKCSSTSSIRRKTRNNKSHGVGQFLTIFFAASCIRRSVALHGLFTSQKPMHSLLFGYMLLQFEKHSQPIATYV